MRVKGHVMTVRRIPADTDQPAWGYTSLCQCGWTCTEPLRVIVADAQRYHCTRSDPRRASGWVCPCGAESRTRAARLAHMLTCPQAPEGWSA